MDRRTQWTLNHANERTWLSAQGHPPQEPLQQALAPPPPPWVPGPGPPLLEQVHVLLRPGQAQRREYPPQLPWVPVLGLGQGCFSLRERARGLVLGRGMYRIWDLGQGLGRRLEQAVEPVRVRAQASGMEQALVLVRAQGQALVLEQAVVRVLEQAVVRVQGMAPEQGQVWVLAMALEPALDRVQGLEQDAVRVLARGLERVWEPVQDMALELV